MDRCKLSCLKSNRNNTNPQLISAFHSTRFTRVLLIPLKVSTNSECQRLISNRLQNNINPNGMGLKYTINSPFFFKITLSKHNLCLKVIQLIMDSMNIILFKLGIGWVSRSRKKIDSLMDLKRFIILTLKTKWPIINKKEDILTNSSVAVSFHWTQIHSYPQILCNSLASKTESRIICSKLKAFCPLSIQVDTVTRSDIRANIKSSVLHILTRHLVLKSHLTLFWLNNLNKNLTRLLKNSTFQL